MSEAGERQFWRPAGGKAISHAKTAKHAKALRAAREKGIRQPWPPDWHHQSIKNTQADESLHDNLTGHTTLMVSYRYDALGRRVQKTVNGDSTTFVLSGAQVIEERDSNGNLVREFIYGSYVDEPLAMIADEQSYYYHANHRYSVAAITNQNGSVIERYAYKAYGQWLVLDANGNEKVDQTPLQPYGYTGRRFDGETDLWYFRARYFDVELGRFVSRDPLGYVDGYSMYRGYFVPGGMDPLGLSDGPPLIAVTVGDGNRSGFPTNSGGVGVGGLGWSIYWAGKGIAGDGFIVQKIERSYQRYACATGYDSDHAPPLYVEDYWEYWPVHDGNVARLMGNQMHDTFRINLNTLGSSYSQDSCGYFLIDAKAAFFPARDAVFNPDGTMLAGYGYASDNPNAHPHSGLAPSIRASAVPIDIVVPGISNSSRNWYTIHRKMVVWWNNCGYCPCPYNFPSGEGVYIDITFPGYDGPLKGDHLYPDKYKMPENINLP